LQVVAAGVRAFERQAAEGALCDYRITQEGLDLVGRCRLTLSKPELKAHLLQRLKRKCDEPLLKRCFPF
jgi:hypothetical protein